MKQVERLGWAAMPRLDETVGMLHQPEPDQKSEPFAHLENQAPWRTLV